MAVWLELPSSPNDSVLAIPAINDLVMLTAIINQIPWLSGEAKSWSSQAICNHHLFRAILTSKGQMVLGRGQTGNQHQSLLVTDEEMA